MIRDSLASMTPLWQPRMRQETWVHHNGYLYSTYIFYMLVLSSLQYAIQKHTCKLYAAPFFCLRIVCPSSSRVRLFTQLCIVETTETQRQHQQQHHHRQQNIITTKRHTLETGPCTRDRWSQYALLCEPRGHPMNLCYILCFPYYARLRGSGYVMSVPCARAPLVLVLGATHCNVISQHRSNRAAPGSTRAEGTPPLPLPQHKARQPQTPGTTAAHTENTPRARVTLNRTRVSSCRLCVSPRNRFGLFGRGSVTETRSRANGGHNIPIFFRCLHRCHCHHRHRHRGAVVVFFCFSGFHLHF